MRKKTFDFNTSNKVSFVSKHDQKKITGGKMPQHIIEHLMNNTSAGCPPPTGG